MSHHTLKPSPFMRVSLFVGCFAAALSLPLAAQDQRTLPVGTNTGLEAAQHNQIPSSASSLAAASSIAAISSSSISDTESVAMLSSAVSESSAMSVSSTSSASLASSMVSSFSSQSSEPALQRKQDSTPLVQDNQPLAGQVIEAGVALDGAAEPISLSKFILGQEVKPNSSVRLTWSSETAVGGFSEETPILVVNGATPGKTLCLTAAVHGDELNGIEMIRRVVYGIEPANLTGTIIGVPVANIMGFRRNSRYLPDRRDWNRYFPGNTHGSSASRLAHSFFSNVIMHCDALVDIHTGSFHRTNLAQLRADLSDENVAKLAQSFGAIAVLNSRGNPNSLRAAAVRAGIPAVTLEAGEPMAIQSSVVDEGVAAVNTLLAKMGMYGKQKRWTRIAPVYYRSAWVRANQSGILFSKATLGQRVKEDDVLGTVTDPITNARTTIKSPYTGRIIGMALDQVVLPGFAAYHIGIQTPEAILIEESQMSDGAVEEDEEDGDDAGLDPIDEKDEPETGMSKAQDRMADE
ncbi:succinylglutamate desuccinylase/aspartoacylase family protein [Cellvibrio fontiphilus]|uniref:Succinylglutamate desuccinylase/aspartoacylase family protein n=1 Tax=Cellvibrio fontiphilus TaxID=1815559 RepID=A0ABV7FIV1_9GAMM